MKAVPFGRYLNIHFEEQSRLMWLSAMYFTSIIGIVWGEAVLEAGFLRYVGVQFLPHAIIGSALVSITSISIYNAVADRTANHTLLIAILSVCVVGFGAGVLLLAFGWVLIAFPLFYVIDSVIIRDLLNVHWPIYVNGFFDTQSAKRVVPVLSSAARIAAILGGLTLPLLNKALSPSAIIFIMLVMQVVMIILAGLFRRSPAARSSVPTVTRQPQEPQSSAAHFQEGYRYVVGSQFLRWMAIAILLMMIVLAFLNYQSGRLLVENLKTVQDISNFTGLLSAAGNLFVLPLQLFLLSRWISRAGVRNSVLLYPTTALAAVTGLVLAPGLVSAGFGFLTRTVLRTTFFNPIDSLLFNAVPLKMKARARGFISGYVMTLGSLVGGLLLILLAHLSVIPILAVLFVILSVAYLASAFKVRGQYRKAVVTMLEQDDYTSLLNSSDGTLTAVDDSTLSQLAAKMSQPGTNPGFQVFVAQVICQTGSDRALPIIDTAIKQASDGHQRARLLEVLAVSGIRSTATGQIFTDFLTDPAKEVRLAALVGFDQCAESNPERFQNQVTSLLADPELDVRASALSALAHHQSFYLETKAALALHSLLMSGQSHERICGLRVLEQLAAENEHPITAEFISSWLASLCDKNDEVRLAAVTALEDTARKTGKVPTWLPLDSLRPLVCDPIERVRYAATILAGLGRQPDTLPLLVEALNDGSPMVRSAAVESLVRHGSYAVHMVQPLLQSPDSRLRTASAMILGRINPTQYASTILSGCLSDHLEAAYRDWGFLSALESVPTTPARTVLQSALFERINQRIDDIFQLLQAIHSSEVVEKITRSLRSQDPLKRANAIEALEVLTTPQIAQRFGSLCATSPDDQSMLPLSASAWNLPELDGEQAIQALSIDSETPWFREVVAAMNLPEGYRQEGSMLSNIEKIIFLKEVPFFQGMTIEQLRVLASVCEEEFFPAETRLFGEGDPGGTLFVVVSGRVGIEQEKRKGSFARLATVESHAYLGEADFFDNNVRTNSAVAIQDTLTLRLRREPLIALARQHPDMSLELINVLSARLREANDRIAGLTRAHPQKLNKLFDQLD